MSTDPSDDKIEASKVQGQPFVASIASDLAGCCC